MKSRTQVKRISVVVIIILLFMVSDCGISPKFTRVFYHDKVNPCTPGEYQDGIECESWKKLYPKEYKSYKERMKNQSIVN